MRRLTSFFWSLLVAGLPLQGTAASFQLQLVADTNTASPSGSQFTSFGATAMSGHNVAFVASEASGESSLILWEDGHRSNVVTTTSPIPGTSQRFTRFYAPSMDGSEVAFTADVDGVVRAGIYHWNGEELSTVVHKSETPPGGAGSFLDLGVVPSLENGMVTFSGTSPPLPRLPVFSHEGIYQSSGGSISVVTNNAVDRIALGDRITLSYSNPISSNGGTIFSASSGIIERVGSSFQFTDHRSSLFLNEDGSTSLLADIAADNISVMGSQIAARAIGESGTSVIELSLEDGAPRVIADLATAVPGESNETLFTVFNGVPGLTADGIFFEGTHYVLGGTLITGVFFEEAPGSLVRVLATGDRIDGRVVQEAKLYGYGSRDPSGAVLNVLFDDGSEAIYAATVIPESSTILLVTFGLIALSLRDSRAVIARR